MSYNLRTRTPIKPSHNLPLDSIMKDIDISGVYKNIKSLRKFLGYSQEYMAQELGVDQTSYGRLERGDRELKLKTLIQIAHILNVKVGDIISFKPEKSLKSIYNKQDVDPNQSVERDSEANYNIYKEEIKRLKETIKDKELIIDLLTKDKK